jgi:hypothetical protein
MPGGVGGAEPRGSPLSRSSRLASWRWLRRRGGTRICWFRFGWSLLVRRHSFAAELHRAHVAAEVEFVAAGDLVAARFAVVGDFKVKVIVFVGFDSPGELAVLEREILRVTLTEWADIDAVEFVV